VTLVVLSDDAAADIERLSAFLLDSLPHEAARTAQVVYSGIDVLATHPAIGRPVGEGARELVISRGRSGYIALYHFDEELDLVIVLGIRHQREAGYH
jgi:plasmid stabilization system protein ParE